jgi:hypothetical protein
MRREHSARHAIVRRLSMMLVIFCAATAQAAVVNVPTGPNAKANGDNFQAVLNGARCGDRIILQAGASYQTRVSFVNRFGPQGYPFILPHKGNCNNGQSITIQSSGIAALPAGVRVGPAQRSQMAQLASNTNSWVIEPAAGAGDYRFIGIEFTHTANVAAQGGFSPVVVFLSLNEAPYGKWGHHMTLDRCIVWPYEEWGNPTSNLRSAAVGVRADGAKQTVINSYIAGFMGFESNSPTTPAQSIGVESVAGPGPLLIQNNLIEAWYSNIFTGGGGGYVDPSHTATLSSSTSTTATLKKLSGLAVGDAIAFRVPPFTNAHGIYTAWASGTVTGISGLTVTFTPLGDPSPNPPSVPGRARWNGLNVSGVRLLGNTLSKRQAWEGGGFGIAKSYWEMKSGVDILVEGNRFLGPGANIMGPLLANQNGDSPWTTIKDVVIRSNLMLTSGAINIELGGNYYGLGSNPGGPVTVTNNLLGASAIRGDGLINGHGQGITWTHNTIRGVTGSMWRQDRLPGSAGVIYQDNIIHSGHYWMQGWPKSFPGGVKDHNVIINNSGGAPPNGYQRDFIAANDAAVGFVDVSGADAGGDYHGYGLSARSAFKGRASDGTDPGVNLMTLDVAIGPLPPPPPGEGNVGGPRPPSNLTVK